MVPSVREINAKDERLILFVGTLPVCELQSAEGLGRSPCPIGQDHFPHASLVPTATRKINQPAVPSLMRVHCTVVCLPAWWTWGYAGCP